MSSLVTWSTGRRPYTAQAALDALVIQTNRDVERELVIVQWHTVGPLRTYDYRVVDTNGTNRARSHLKGLADWQKRNEAGEIFPDYWFCFDDDVVPCRDYFDRMQAICEADPSIGVIGPWNDCAQRQTNGDWHGDTKLVAGEWVQYGTDFNVGGAGMCIPKRTLVDVGYYDPEMTWLEDHDFTQRVRAAGLQACVARTVFAVILEDDLYDPAYRGEMTELFLKNRKEKLGW